MNRQLQLTARITTLPDQEHVGTGSFGSSLHAAHIMYPIEGARHDVVRADVSCHL